MGRLALHKLTINKCAAAVLLVGCLGVQGGVANEVCQEEAGNRHHDLGNWAKAYELLRPCGMVPGVSGKTLYRLAEHVGVYGQGEYVSREVRHFKWIGLYFRSALEGYGPGITKFADALDTKARVVADNASAEMAICLRSTLNSPDIGRERLVKNCLPKRDP